MKNPGYAYLCHLKKNVNMSIVLLLSINHGKRPRYLGVFLDPLLSFHNHIEYLRLEIAQNIGSMYRVTNVFPFTILKIIYYSLIASHLNYCSVVYLNTFWKNIKPLQVLQNRAIRILGNFLHRPSKRENVSKTKTLFLFLNLLDLNGIKVLNTSARYFQIQNLIIISVINLCQFYFLVRIVGGLGCTEFLL